jgi:uncharacterized protein YacL (UPF0231 family)
MADETVAAPAADTSVDTGVESTESQEASTTEGAEETTAAPVAAAKPAPSSKRKLKLKVDGEEFDEDFDPNDEESIVRNLQLAKVAQKRMQEYSSLQKEVVKFIEDLRKDPKTVLSDPRIGLDVKKIAAEIIEQEIENSKKSPEQLELEKTRAEIKALKEGQERDKAEALEREKARLTEEQFERYDIEVTAALASSDLPKSPYVVKKIADYMLIGLEANKDISPADVMPLVREEIMSDLKAMFDVMPEDVVEKLIGKSKFDSIRKKNIKAAKEKNAQVGSTKTTDVGQKTTSKTGTEKKQTFKQFFGV